MTAIKKVILPSNIEKFLRAGTGQSYTKDETLTDLQRHRHTFTSGDSYLEESAHRIVSVCMDLEVRLAGARLIQAAQNIELGRASEAREALDLANQLLESAFATAEKERLLLTIHRADQIEAIAVISYQLEQLLKQTASESISEHTHSQASKIIAPVPPEPVDTL